MVHSFFYPYKLSDQCYVIEIKYAKNEYSENEDNDSKFQPSYQVFFNKIYVTLLNSRIIYINAYVEHNNQRIFQMML